MQARFLVLGAGFILGIWFSSLWPWGFSVAGLAIGLALIFWLVRFKFEREERRLFLLPILFLVFFAGGSARMEWRGIIGHESDLRAGERIETLGVVMAEPKVGNTTTQLLVETEARERFLLFSELYPAYKLGDKLEFSGQLTKPKNFLTESGREFDYESFLARQDIHWQVFRPEIELVAHGEAGLVRGALSALRRQFMTGVESVLPEPEAGLLAGLIIGARSSLDKAVLEDFRRVGLTHMIVLSGYNLTIVAEAVRNLLRFLPFYPNLGFAGLSIFLFALMAGGGAAVWRATLMALLGLFARATGRIYDASLALLATILVLLLWDPRYLVFDLGFQLSILATLGLIFLSPLVAPYLRFLPDYFGFREVVGTTIAAQVAVLPWLLYQLGELSLVSFVVNPLVLIVIPPIMLFGFLAGLLALVSTTLAFLPGAVAHLLLSYQLFIVSFFARLPFAIKTIPYFPLVAVFFVYALYIYCYYRKREIFQTSLGGGR